MHGIQAETADESYVGLSVNAAGVYVGMTPRKFRTESFHVAGDLDTARQQLEEIITRMPQETTLMDARVAAAAEVASAARTVYVDMVPDPWQNRPWCHVVDVDALLTAERGSQQQLRCSLGRVVDRLEGWEKALVHLDKRLAELASRDAAARSGRPVEAAERAKLTEARRKLCDVGSRTRSAAPKPTAKPHASHAPKTSSPSPRKRRLRAPTNRHSTRATPTDSSGVRPQLITLPSCSLR